MINKLFLKKSPWDDTGSDNIFLKKKSDFRSRFPKDIQFDPTPRNIVMMVMGLVLLWFVSGVYKVQEGEEAVIIRFGRFVRVATPGLNYHLPAPFETVVIERVNKSRRVEIGYRSTKEHEYGSNINTENLMLTGDQNIINLNCDVMWHIKNLEAYVFSSVSPEGTVKRAAESAIREVIGASPIVSVLSNQKQEIADKIEKLTQKILDSYNIGITIEKVQLLKAEPPAEVIDAYRDVQTSRSDKERSINQAQSYSNDVLPKARGEAAKIIQEAEGYKHSTISKAQGDSSRFKSILAQYNNSKQVTKDRMYLEMVEQVLGGSKKVIMGAETLPHMAIDQK
jgi:modulator of FtsH protease HflK